MKNNKAFTLLEVLISMTLITVIVIIGIMSLNLARKGRAKASEHVEISQIERTLYLNLVRPLRGIYPYYKQNEKGQLLLRFSGTSTTISFVTTYTEPWRDSIIQKPGLKWMKIFLDDLNELKIRENIFYLDNPEDNANERILYDAIEELNFEYLDPVQDEWLSEWQQEKNYLPSAIKINLSFRYKNKTFSMPTIIVKIRARYRWI